MPHRTERVVEPTDVDDLGHASNIVYVRWVQDAAVAHSTAVGLGPAAYLERGQVFVVRRHTIDYLRPLLPGETFVVETRVVSLRSASSERETVLTRGDDVIATARTLWAYVDAATGRPTRIPPDVAARFELEPPTK